jgi:hypothetical protein
MNRQAGIYVVITILSAGVLFLALTPLAIGEEEPKLFKAKDGSGIIGYKDTPILPWCGYHARP